MEQQNNEHVEAGEGDSASVTFEILDSLSAHSTPEEVNSAITKYSTLLDDIVKDSIDVVKISETISRAWKVPTHGHFIVKSLFKSLEENKGIDLMMTDSANLTEELQVSLAELLDYCLQTDTKAYLVDNWLEKVVEIACLRFSEENDYLKQVAILKNLLNYNEATCSEVINFGGFDVVLFGCRSFDTRALRHCTEALLNVSLFGGPTNYEEIINNRKLQMWLFPLALHVDDIVKYNTCLALCVIFGNADAEAQSDILRSGTFDLVEPFVSSHNPSEFARTDMYSHEKGKEWLLRLVPLLSSSNEVIRMLGAFHFCVEVEFKTENNTTAVLKEIGAIELLRKMAGPDESCISKYVTEALKQMEEGSQDNV